MSAESKLGPEDELHELRCWPKFFELLWSGEKTCEVRNNDRGYEKGDVLRLMEYDPTSLKYTGREIMAKVTHILHLKAGEGYGNPIRIVDYSHKTSIKMDKACVMSIKILEKREGKEVT